MILTSFYEVWRDLMDNKSDPRTSEWPLMSSPFPTIAISLTYACCVKVIEYKVYINNDENINYIAIGFM